MPLRSFTPHRRKFALCNLALSMLFALALAAAINYLAARHPIRQKWLETDRFQLSPLTLGILDGLTNDIQITVYHHRDNASALHSSIDGLLAEYAYRSPQVNVRHVDYARDRRAAMEVSQDYGLADRAPSDLIIFAASERFRIVTHQELRDYRTAAKADALLRGHREIQRVGFKGELLFTSAIRSITSGEPLEIAYLVGHGEHDLESRDRDGYASFRQTLEEKNFQLAPHHLINDGPLSETIPMVVIAGPRRPFVPEELAELRRFLQRGGCLFLLFNVNAVQTVTGLENLVQEWGVQVGMNVVDDVHKLMETELALADYAEHPVTTPLVDAQAALLMYLPRSVDPLLHRAMTSTREMFAQGIAFTSTNGVTQSEWQRGRPQFNRYRDRRGAIPVLAVAEVEVAPQVKAKLSNQTRLLVAGDSFFLANERIQQAGNRDFAGLAAGWLLDQYQLLQGIGPKPLYEFTLSIPEPKFQRLQILMIAVFPGIVFLVGMVVWWRRRV